MIPKNNSIRPATAALFACLMAGPASAGLAAGGPLSGALTYVQDNLVTDIETLAIIGIGLVLFSQQIRWQFVLAICAGLWMLANPDTFRTAVTGG